MKRCIKCNKEKSEEEFYANWSHWCNSCIDKLRKRQEDNEYRKNGGIDGKEGYMMLKYPDRESLGG